MSALGQKQTCAVQKGMSALPRKADVALCPAAKILFSRGAHDFVRFGRDAEPPQQARQLPTLAVCAVLGLFAACVQRL